MAGTPVPRAAKRGLDLYRPASLTASVLRAYILAYVSTASPRLISLIFSAARRKRTTQDALQKILATVSRAAALDHFPAAAALFVWGSILLPRHALDLIARLQTDIASRTRTAALKNSPVVRFVSAFFTSIFVFRLLNRELSKPEPTLRSRRSRNVSEPEIALRTATEALVPDGDNNHSRASSPIITPTRAVFVEEIPPLAGNTLSLTTFGMTHALTVIGGTLGQMYRQSSPARLNTPPLRTVAAPAGFITTSAVVMFCWFYYPERLPRGYCNWITSAAEIDERIIEALRQCRFGTWTYGKTDSDKELLGGMARELGYPEEWGDPGLGGPLPCELYHHPYGPSCEWHAIGRFVRAFNFAFRMYLPLNLLVLVRRQDLTRALKQSVIGASRSSAFLAGFISFFYYGVCLTRTRVGPWLLGNTVKTRNYLDSGLCVAVGTFACGWSILLEAPGRRQEMALFVSPRALSAILPRRYDRKHMWREELAFALSGATILTALAHDPNAVRGVFGKVLRRLFE